MLRLEKKVSGSLKLVASLLSCIILILNAGGFGWAVVLASDSILYFHENSLRSDLSLFGGAERIYEDADAITPTATVPVVDTMHALIPTARLSEVGINLNLPQSGYFGYDAWLFGTPGNSVIDGDVEIHAWMSSNDNPGFLGGSAYFFAVADVNPINLLDSPKVLWYDGKSGIGNIIGSSQSRLSTTDFAHPFKIVNHFFAAGRALLFLVGAGSTKEGWQFNIYFDNSSDPSGATIPTPAIKSQEPTSCQISVSLTASPSGGTAPLTITFDATVTGAYGAVQYDWWFGDGAHITGNPSMTYTYADPWNYSVVVSVLDAKGCWSKTGTIVTVTPKNVPEFPASAVLIMTIATMMTVLALRFSKRRDYSCRRE